MENDEKVIQTEMKVEPDAAAIPTVDLAKIDTIKPPKGMSQEESVKIKSQASDLVKQLSESSGSKELEIMDSLTNLGVQSQRNAAGHLDLLKARVSTLLSEGGPSREIADSLRDLRINLEAIDPHANNHSLWHRAWKVFPYGGRYNPVRILQKIAIRYEPVARQINLIEIKLRDGRTMLVRDNIELRKLYEQLEQQQPVIQRNAYLGSMLMEYLTQMLQQTPDALKRERIRAALHDVAMRVQDLKTMEEVYVQYYVSIEISRQNNNRLGQAVDRTLTLTTNVVTVGLAIQAALVRQKSVMVATRRTREFLGTLITENASAIKMHTKEIGDLYTNPVIAMEKIAQAHNDLVEAMDMADRLRQEGISTARENIARLSQMSAGLMERASGLLQEGKNNSDSDLKPAGIEATQQPEH